MSLIGYQQDVFNKLYHLFVEKECSSVILTGPRGCGKNYIVENFASSPLENWQIFILKGNGELNPPYSAWYNCTPANLQNIQLSNISLGINFRPIGLPIGGGFGVRFSENHILFNENEQSIIKIITNKSLGSNHILFVVEDYSSWDTSSKELLFKIKSLREKLFGVNKVVHSLITVSKSEIDNILIEDNDVLITIEDESISIDDIRNIIESKLNIDILQIPDIDKIIDFTGKDIDLIILAIHYKDGNTTALEVNSFQKLLEKRVASIPQNQRKICRILECVSILNNFFSEKEAAYLLEGNQASTERSLDKAVDMRLICKKQEYDFPNDEIRIFFENRLDSEKKYLHYKFSKYLQNNFPQDYLNRAYHLSMSGKAYSDHNLLEAVYLLSLEIARRMDVTGFLPDSILMRNLDDMIAQLPSMVQKIIKTNINDYLTAQNQLHQGFYSDAIMHLNNLNLIFASRVFYIDVQRILLLSHVLLADDRNEIKRLSEDLYENISDASFHEDELWCLVALVLFEVFGDRNVDLEKFKHIKKGFEERIRIHMYQSTFCALHAKYASKSILFYNAMIAAKMTEESCQYYRDCNSFSNLYLSLCNNAANKIVCGDYNLALESLQECKSITEKNSDTYFPSFYKIENNIIIAEFLKKEGRLLNYDSRDRNTILEAASIASKQLVSIQNQQGVEISHVIEFNIISMYLIGGQIEKAENLCKKFEYQYNQLDPFYRYYYHNACFALCLLNRLHLQASEHLEKLENLDVILLHSFSRILEERNKILHHLIDEPFIGDSFDLNYVILKNGFRVQDTSASFWGRMFLLADLQFLSL